MDTITKRIKLDFNKLDEYRDEKKDGLPIYSMLSFYQAAGVSDVIREYAEELGNQVAAIDVISCSFYTQQHIKKFVAERWEVFSLSLLDNNKVVWNTGTFPKGSKHYNRKPSKKVQKSLGYDFLNYCPRLNDELDDDVIEIEIPVKE